MCRHRFSQALEQRIIYHAWRRQGAMRALHRKYLHGRTDGQGKPTKRARTQRTDKGKVV